MCALRRELAIDFAELRCLEIRCNCGTKITIDIGGKDLLTPKMCPGCNGAFGDTFEKSLQTFKQAYRGFVLVNIDSKLPSVGLRIPFDSAHQQEKEDGALK
jgi:hypothetical protein